MRQGMVVTMGAQTTNGSARASRRALLALGMVVVLGLSALSGAGGFVGSASATNHETITTCERTIDAAGTYEIGGDLSNAGNSACVKITAPDVVLDGQGNTVTGEAADDVGVLVVGEGVETVDVRNLTVKDFKRGFDIGGSPDVTVENVDVSGAEVGINVAGSPDSTITNATVTGTSRGGIHLSEADGAVVRDTSVSGAEILGIRVRSSSEAVLENVTVESVRGPGDIEGSGGAGIAVHSSDGFTANGVSVRDTDHDGIIVTGSPSATIRESSITRATGAGIYVFPVVQRTIESSDAEVEQESATVTISGTEITGTRVGQVRVPYFEGTVPAGVGVYGVGSGHISLQDVTVSDSKFTGLLFMGVEGSLSFDVADSQVSGVDAVEGSNAAGVANLYAAGTLRNTEITGAAGDGVHVAGDLSISGSDTFIGENGRHGVNVEEESIGPAEFDVSVTDATVARNGGRDLRATGPNALTATDVDISASTAADTTVDAELFNASLAAVGSIPATPGAQSATGRAIDLRGHGTSGYADVTLDYADGDVAGLDESTLSVWRHDGAWSEVGGTVDTNANTVSANLSALGTFSLLAEPATTGGNTGGGGGGGGGSGDFGTPSIEVIDATVDDDSIEPGDTVRVNVTLENAGDGDGTTEVNLTVDGERTDSQKVYVGAGQTRSFDFEYTVGEEGDYALAAGDESAGTVTAAVPSTPTAAGSPTPTPTPTPTATPAPTATATATDAGGAAPTPDDSGGGGLGPFVVIGLVAVVGGIAGAGWLVVREE